MPDATPATPMIDWTPVAAAIIAMSGESGMLIDYRGAMHDDMQWFVGDGDVEVYGPTLADAIAKFVRVAAHMQRTEV